MQLSHRRQSFLGSLPSGPQGTHATLRMMRQLVHQYKSDTHVRGVALDVVSGVRPKDWLGEIRALFEYVRDRIRYVRDIAGVETLQTPPVTIDLEAGDCDDKSTLLSALLASVGHESRFVAVGYTNPGDYQHVYVEAKLDDRWVPLDPTVMQPFGWAPRTPVSRMVLSV